MNINIKTKKKTPNPNNATVPIPNNILIILIFDSVTILPSEVNLLYSRFAENIDLHLIFSFCVKAATIKYIPYKKGRIKIKLNHAIEKYDKTITVKDKTIKIDEMVILFLKLRLEITLSLYSKNI